MSQYPEPTQPGYFSSPEFEARTEARKRIQARRDLATHVVVYVVVNAFLIGIWWWTGGGYFWPAWVLGGWGIGLVMNVWDVLFRRPITEDDIDRELRRRSGS